MGLRLRTVPAAAVLLVAVAAFSGCGGDSKPAEGIISSVDKARAAQALSSLQQGLITVQTTAVESGGATPGAADLATALQQHDPNNRYTTAPPTDVGIVQVVGGGGGPIMLVGISAPPSSPRPPDYLAVWESGGTTLFYLGQQAPAYSTSPPSGTGWSSSPPQI
jgi:hypothetical protein